MIKTDFKMDERNVGMFRTVCTTLYAITLLLLAGTLFYRQFVLKQAVQEFEDIAIILTFNAVVMLGAVLYFGGITFRRFKLKTILTIYTAFVILGFSFTVLKYRILVDPPLSYSEILGKLLIVVIICGAFIALWTMAAYFGKCKTEKELE